MSLACGIVWVHASSKVDISATGEDWLSFTEEEKVTLMSTIFNILKVDRQHKAQDGINALDRFYSMRMFQSSPDSEKKDVLQIPCIDIIKHFMTQE